MGINLTAQLSKLDALNSMASYIGIPPIQNISEVPLSPDFQLAELILDEMVNEVCSHGMPCNTDYKYELTPDGVTGEIAVPAGAISIFPEDPNQGYFVERDGKLYDLDNQTDVFTSPVEVTIYWLYDFESLPQVVRKYLAVASARRFVSRVKGDDAVLQTTQLDLLRAETEFLSYSQQIGSVNMIYDNAETSYIIDNNTPNSGYDYRAY